jgi:hypothetical protein
MILKSALLWIDAIHNNLIIHLIIIQLHFIILFSIVAFLWGGFIPWIVFGVIIMYFLFDDFIYPLIIQRRKGTYREKIEAQKKLEAQRPSITKILLGPAKYSREASFILPILLFVFISFPAGRFTARSKAYFYVLSDSKDVALLRIYGDKVIAASFDRNAKEISRNLTILSLPDQGQLKLNYEKIGPLKVRKNKEETKRQPKAATKQQIPCSSRETTCQQGRLCNLYAHAESFNEIEKTIKKLRKLLIRKEVCVSRFIYTE